MTSDVESDLKQPKHVLKSCCLMMMMMINPLKCFYGIKGHAALDGNLGPGYKTLLLRLVPEDLLSACPHGQFHTLPANLCVPSREAVCTIFMVSGILTYM